MAAMPKSLPRLRAAAVRIPELPRAALVALVPSRRGVAVSAAILVAAFAAYGVVRFTSVFAIERVRVDGAPPALAAKVQATLAPLAGQSLLRLDGDALVRRLQAIPEIEGATYDRAFPNTLAVSVQREIPLAVLRRGRASWLLSARGRVLAQVPTGAFPRLPRIWAPAEAVAPPGAVIGHRRVAAPLRPLRVLPKVFPVRVRAAASTPAGTELTLGTGATLRLGDARDLPLKLAVAATVLADLPRPSNGGPDYLDVSLPERPVAGQKARVEGSG